jgi:hypothetical protein
MRWIQWIVCPILALTFPPAVRSQSSVVISGQVVNLQGVPQPFATVRICPQTASGIPCTPLALIYSDPGLTTPIANPTAANQYGFFSVFVGTGTSFYQVQTTFGTTTYPYWANGFIGGEASFSPTGLQFATSSSAARVATPGDIATLLSTLTGCATPNYFYSPGSAICAASGGTPASPSYAVQFANSSASAFQADSSITINPTTHQLTAPLTLSSANQVINVQAPPYNAACNLTGYSGNYTSAGGSITASSNVFTSTAGVFTAAMASPTPYTVVIWNAGAVQSNGSIAPLVTTVASYQSPTQVTLATPATTAVNYGYFEIGINDETAIQSAVNAACSAHLAVLIPANNNLSCLVGTTNGSGLGIDLSAGSACAGPVPVQGQGSTVSSITGLPGDDIFSTPANLKISGNYALYAGLTAYLDVSEDVSGSSGVFATRITGTGGGTTAISPAISPGPVVLDSCTLASGTLTCPHGEFNIPPKWLFTSGTIAFTSSGLGLTNATITPTGNTTATVSGGTPGTSTATYGFLNGGVLTGLIPPWYVGNAAFAFPASNYSYSGAPQLIFDDIKINVVGWESPSAVTSLDPFTHGAGLFIQQEPYFTSFDELSIRGPQYCYVEALPPAGTATVWTPDTWHFGTGQLSCTIPAVFYAGNHRTYKNLNMYGANAPFGLGAFWLQPPTGSLAGQVTIDQYYWENWGSSTASVLFGNSGEGQRFTGSAFTILGGSLTQSASQQYTNWLAKNSVVTDTLIGGPEYQLSPTTAALQVSGNNNKFIGDAFNANSGVTTTATAIGSVNDTGKGNQFEDLNNGTHPYFLEATQPDLNTLTGDFLFDNLSSTPYLSRAGLFTTANDWTVTGATATLTPAVAGDGNIGPNYLAINAGTSQITVSFTGEPMAVGYRIPQVATVYAVAYLNSPGGSTSVTLRIRDVTTSTYLNNCVFTSVSTTWAEHGYAGSADACTMNLSSVSVGDVLGFILFQSSTQAIGFANLAFVPASSAPIPLPNGSTAVTQPLGDATNNVSTDDFVSRAVSSAAGVNIFSWTNGPTSGTNVPFVSNILTCIPFSLLGNDTSTNIGYFVSTADNSSNLYSLSVYSGTAGSTGAPFCTTGAVAGTSIVPATGWRKQAWSASCSLTGGSEYWMCLTGNAATATLLGANVGASDSIMTNVTTSTGGVPPASVTLPANSSCINATGCTPPLFHLQPY